MTTMTPKRVQGTVRPSSGNNIQAHFPLTTYPGLSSALSLVECGGCEKDFLILNNRAVWPLSVPPTPEGVPPKVGEAYKDSRTALAAGAPIAGIMAARTTLIRMLREQGVSQFKELVDKQVLTPTLYGGADQIRGWAGVIGHDDIEVDELQRAELEDLLDYMATVLEAVYTQPARVARFARRTGELKQGGTRRPSNPGRPQPDRG